LVVRTSRRNLLVLKISFIFWNAAAACIMTGRCWCELLKLISCIKFILFKWNLSWILAWFWNCCGMLYNCKVYLMVPVLLGEISNCTVQKTCNQGELVLEKQKVVSVIFMLLNWVVDLKYVL
jgi:hypothetical protein